MELKATVEINLVMEDGETLEQASDRLYDMLYDGLCRNANCNFWIESAEEAD